MKIQHQAIQYAAKLLSEGKLVAFPTETVYGLGGDARNETAIQKIYQIKKRPTTNPLIIHLSNVTAMENFATHIPDAAYQLAEQFWPGPLTLVLKKKPDVSTWVTGGQNTVALRVPAHPVALSLLNEFGGGIAAPSANRYTEISPTHFSHVQNKLGKDLDYILDGGPCSIGIESTIVSMVEALPVILREGHIKKEDISHCLGCETKTNQKDSAIHVPGSALKHYAPKKPLYIVPAKEILSTLNQLRQRDYSCAVLSFESTKQKLKNNIDLIWIGLAADPLIYAQHLYAALHELESGPSHCIIVESLPSSEDWSAIQDRLSRAATQPMSLNFVPV